MIPSFPKGNKMYIDSKLNIYFFYVKNIHSFFFEKTVFSRVKNTFSFMSETRFLFLPNKRPFFSLYFPRKIWKSIGSSIGGNCELEAILNGLHNKWECRPPPGLPNFLSNLGQIDPKWDKSGICSAPKYSVRQNVLILF